MNDIVIKAENLGKKYVIGHQAERGRYTALRDVLMQNARTLWNKTKDLATGKPIIQGDTLEEVWALKDVSFEVRRGEAVGIIGRNGAGKSTLLKILSRITEPTTGRVTIKGRVASLLEVGTGFHPELTGRENIYLNGTILGMTRVEIKQKFDEIVAFAEIEKFLDTPVKRYSSGMYVRLAFAIAAHMEPEILLVDEVLAVGDIQFQKKCLGKMAEVGKDGRTVLFVSHNIGAISSLTERVLWINNGMLHMAGPMKTVTASYVVQGYRKASVWKASQLTNHPMQILRAEVCSDDSGGDLLDVRRGLRFMVDYVVREPIRGAVVSVIIHAPDGASILATEDVDTNMELLERRLPGKYRAEVTIPADWLSAGTYLLRLHCGVVFQAIFDNVEALSFELIETGDPKLRDHKQAYILPYLTWSYNHLSEEESKT